MACGANETPSATPTTQLGESATATTSAVPASSTLSSPFDGGAPHGGLPAEQVRRVVMSHTGALRACYELLASSNPDLRGGVSVAWDIDPQGNVHHAHIVQSTFSEPKLGECVVRQIESWQFDSSNAPTFVAQYPFKFGVQKDAGAQ